MSSQQTQPHKRPIDKISSPSSDIPRTRSRHDPDKLYSGISSSNALAYLDQTIIAKVREREDDDGPLSEDAIAKMVVGVLIRQSGRKRSKNDTGRLLQQYPSLRTMSQEGYNSRSFKHMRGLSVFAPNPDMSEMWSQVTLERIGLESDAIKDEEHDVLDETIYAYLLKQVASPRDMLVDLSRGDNSYLEEITIVEAESLLEQSPVLEEIIGSITSMGISFKEVRRLVKIRKPPDTSKRAQNYEEQAQIIKEAWNINYVGRAHEILLTNINSMDRSGLYSNMVPLIQSSGSGKSRMVREQAKLVFTLPFNLRDIADTKSLAWPPPDSDVAAYLMRQSSCVEEGKIRHLRFFRHLFYVVKKAVQSLRSNGPKYVNHAVLALAWHEHMEKPGVRLKLYAGALGLSEADNSRHRENSTKLDDAYVTTVAKEAREELEGLIQSLDSICLTAPNNDDVKVMMNFDEVHTLSKYGYTKPGEIYGRDMFDILSFCIDALREKPIFSIFLSTNSHISQLAPPASQARSSRLRHNEKPLQAPITETPFDNCNTLPVNKNATLRFSQVIGVKFLAQFGRPLFWTYLESASGENKEEGLVELAREKLLYSSRIHLGHKHFLEKPAALTAVVDTLLNLNFDVGRQSSVAREGELVASHMRVAYSVPSHRQYFRSGYPSEPILAEAAAQQLDRFQTLAPETDILATLLQNHFESGLLDEGQRGEVVMRQLILTAYMRACKKDKLGVAHALFSGGCHLVTFIEELFVENYAQEVLNSKPDNYDDKSGASQPLREVFKDAIVRFTHFGKMADDTGPSSHTMYAAFIRSMAIICWSSQFAVDILLPILFLKDGVLSEAAMSAFMLQVKRRKNAGKYHFTAEDLNFFEEGKPRPYITMVAELGVQIPVTGLAATKVHVHGKTTKKVHNSGATREPKASDSRSTTQDVFSDAYKTPSKLEVAGPPQRRWERINSTPHPHYSIVAHGCSNTVYRVIDPKDRDLYALLLAHRDFLGEHARQDTESLAMIRRMKPFWSTNNNCYEWIKDDVLNNPPEMKPDTETWLKAGRGTSDI